MQFHLQELELNINIQNKSPSASSRALCLSSCPLWEQTLPRFFKPTRLITSHDSQCTWLPPPNWEKHKQIVHKSPEAAAGVVHSLRSNYLLSSVPLAAVIWLTFQHRSGWLMTFCLNRLTPQTLPGTWTRISSPSLCIAESMPLLHHILTKVRENV